jgi:hypothetical protein
MKGDFMPEYDKQGPDDGQQKDMTPEERERALEKLNDLKQYLADSFREVSDNIQEKVQELEFDTEDLKDDMLDEFDDLNDEKEDIMEEIEDLKAGRVNDNMNILNEVEDLKDRLAQLEERKKEIIEKYKRKVESKKEKAVRKARKHADKALREADKAKERAKRINISVPADMSEEWKDWAEELGASVSELIRNSMEFVKDNIGNLDKLEKVGATFDHIETVSDLKDLDKKLKIQIDAGKQNAKKVLGQDLDTMKKRAKGLVKLHKSVPISKLALVLNISEEKAEALIYELAAEGIDGDLDYETGIFTFRSGEEQVIETLHRLIDRNFA